MLITNDEEWLIQNITMAVRRELAKQKQGGENWAIAGFEQLVREFVPTALNEWAELHDDVFPDDITCGSITEKYDDHLSSTLSNCSR